MNPIWPRWLKTVYVVLCLVFAAGLMLTWSWLIGPAIPPVIAWLDGTFGEWGAAGVMLVFFGALGIYAYRN